MKAGEWNYEVFWKEGVSQIQEEISEQEFLMWIRNMEYLASNDSQIVIGVPSTFYKDQVSQRYLRRIEAKLFELSGHKIALTFKIQQKEPEKPEKGSDRQRGDPSGREAPQGRDQPAGREAPQGRDQPAGRPKASPAPRKGRRPQGP